MTHVKVIQHPLVQHKLTQLRKKDTSSNNFRSILAEISALLGYEAMRGWHTHESEIDTPIMSNQKFQTIKQQEIVLVPILRAGLGMLPGMLQLVPNAQIMHLGLQRNPQSLQPIEYYCNLPKNLQDKHVIILDPMIATGYSAITAIANVQQRQPKSLVFIAILVTPKGIAHINAHFPKVQIYVAEIDHGLNEHGYIMPGLGDAGDRLHAMI